MAHAPARCAGARWARQRERVRELEAAHIAASARIFLAAIALQGGRREMSEPRERRRNLELRKRTGTRSRQTVPLLEYEYTVVTTVD